jgi:chitodextrinase
VVTATTSSSVTLMWMASPGAASYQVHLALAPVTTGAQPVLTGLTAATATVTGLMPNTTYYFHVHAVDAAGHLSRHSNVVMAKTGP